MQSRRKRLSSYSRLTPVLFLAPAMLGILIFKLYPLLKVLVSSFFQFSFASKAEYFAGIQNYVEAFTDPVFQNSIKVTLVFNLIVNPLQILISFSLALLLMSNLKGKKVFRTLHLIPITVSFTIACILWGVLLNPEHGLVNSILNLFGLENQSFLYSQHQALGTVIAIASWNGVGYWALFFLAGLDEVPAHLYEAAAICGAGR